MPKGYANQLLYLLLVPFFFILFCFLYQPFGILESLQMLSMHNESFHLLMLTIIILVTIAVTRLILSVLCDRLSFTIGQYLIWCAGELIASSLFMALYLSLFSREPYFFALSLTLKYCFLILVYPYSYLILRRIILRKDEILAEATKPAETTLFKIFDEHKKLKFTIDPKSLIYISAEANYIKLYYLENSNIKEFILRASMKSLEQSAPSHGLIRCHRSYYVNPSYIKVLGRNPEGVFIAELLDGKRQVPVSKQYYETLTNIL